ncbi:hypothetical protein EBZ80_20400 [bacterium]|nr:hypothetical protein [bacterium]
MTSLAAGYVEGFLANYASENGAASFVTGRTFIRVFAYAAERWNLAAEIEGENGRPVGTGLELSDDGTRLVSFGPHAAVVSTFVLLSGGQWEERDPINLDDGRYVDMVAMSADGTVLAVPSLTNDNISELRTYRWNDQWVTSGLVNLLDNMSYIQDLSFIFAGNGSTNLICHLIMGDDSDSGYSVEKTVYVFQWDESTNWPLLYTIADTRYLGAGEVGHRIVIARDDDTIATVIPDWSGGEWALGNQVVNIGQVTIPVLSADESTLILKTSAFLYVYRFSEGSGWIPLGRILEVVFNNGVYTDDPNSADIFDNQSLLSANSTLPNYLCISSNGLYIAVSNIHNRARVLAYGSAPCFHGATPLALAGGGTVRASAVRPGMLLMDSRGQGQRVIEDAPFVEIPTGAVGNTSTLRVTPNHLLRVPGFGTVRADRALQLNGRGCKPAGQATVYHVGLRQWTFLPVCGIEAESWAWRAEDQAQRPGYRAVELPAATVSQKPASILWGVRRRVRIARHARARKS